MTESKIQQHATGTLDTLYRSVRKVIEGARRFVSIAANTALVKQNWEIGRLIVEDEQGGKRKAEYGKAQLEGLANRLTTEYGNGYDERNLRYMRAFYLSFPNWNALRSELNWTHYRIIMRETDLTAREWYMNECVACGWSTRELERQVSTQAYSRLLSAANPDKRRKRQLPSNTPMPEQPKSLVPADFIKNPMILEFLSLADDIRLRETELESAIISHLKDVLMELGRGFCFVARQKHIHSGSDDYFIDLVFYNCILKYHSPLDATTSALTSRVLFAGEEYAQEDEDGSSGGNQRQVFVKEKRGAESSDRRHEIKSDGTARCSQSLAGLVPQHEADCRGEDAEKREIQTVHGIGEPRRIDGRREPHGHGRIHDDACRAGQAEEQERQHDDKRPEEHPPHDEQLRPPAAGLFFHHQRIAAPADHGSESH